MIIQRFSGKDIHVHITGTDKEKIIKGESLIKSAERQKNYNQKGITIWITGLHGSGKNELAYSLERQLFDMGATVVLLDGKSTRQGLSRELDYSPNDRAEHLRRIAHISRLLNEQGVITICSFISPDDSIREQVSEIVGKENFHLIYQDAELDFCRTNDEYGLYQMADSGDLKYLPGVDMDYDIPQVPALRLDANQKEMNAQKVIDYLLTKKIFPLE
jgi:adenylyl-sulfate kinase